MLFYEYKIHIIHIERICMTKMYDYIDNDDTMITKSRTLKKYEINLR